MCVLPFLQPRHFPPIRTFYDEWLAFALGLAAVAFASAARRNLTTRAPALAVCLFVFALIQTLRALGTPVAYPQSALMWALYSLFASLLVVLGKSLAEHLGLQRSCDLLASFLLAGAIANSVCGILQVVGIPQSIDAFVSYLHGSRAIGNVGQPNLFANYLALGGASLCYLYARDRIGIVTSAALALPLLIGTGLALSRSSLLYFLVFLLLGWVALRHCHGPVGRRICVATIALAIAGSQLHWAVPAASNALGFLIERNIPADWSAQVEPSTALRLIVWQLAWKLFIASPWIGVGPGEFSGAAFAHGLPIELADAGVWTSPHNFILQLLCESGVVGCLPIAAGLVLWAARLKTVALENLDAATWWVATCVGVEFVHALLEYPLWYGNFLAVTALLAGLGSAGGVELSVRSGRWLIATCAILGGLVLAGAIRDYARFDLALSASSGRSLADESVASDSRNVLRQLRGGVLAPQIETSLFLGLTLNPDGLAEKLEIGQRVLRVWPSVQVAARQSIYLALAGRKGEAVALLDRTLSTSKAQRSKIGAIISTAPQPARSILQPVLR